MFATIELRIFCILVSHLRTQKMKIHKNITSAVLYGCGIWTLVLREEHTLRVFDNRVLRRIFQT